MIPTYVALIVEGCLRGFGMIPLVCRPLGEGLWVGSRSWIGLVPC